MGEVVPPSDRRRKLDAAISVLAARAKAAGVVDDLTLVDRMRQEAEGLHALYGVPFRWVWGQVNRGFSGANNLGVSVAQGEHLIFLNSDVFPVDPGWAQALSEALEAHPTLGAIAPSSGDTAVVVLAA